MLAYAHYVGAARFEINHRVARIPELPAEFRGLRILHLSDFHSRERHWRFDWFLERVRRRLEEAPVDLILITGDFFENTEGREYIAEALGSLDSRLGAFGVLGNHDYYHYSVGSVLLQRQVGDSRHDIPAFCARMAEVGVTILRNEVRRLEVNGQTIDLIGVDDPVTEHDDWPRTFADLEARSPADLRLLLAHTPDFFWQRRESPAPVAFCGHTHGGQVVFPWGELTTQSNLQRGYASGVLNNAGCVTFISRGAGTSEIIPFRLNCRPEASFITLAEGPANGVEPRWCGPRSAAFWKTVRWWALKVEQWLFGQT